MRPHNHIACSLTVANDRFICNVCKQSAPHGELDTFIEHFCPPKRDEEIRGAMLALSRLMHWAWLEMKARCRLMPTDCLDEWDHDHPIHTARSVMFLNYALDSYASLNKQHFLKVEYLLPKKDEWDE